MSKKRYWPFVKRTRDISGAPLPPPSQEATPLPRLLHTFFSLSLHAFITCLCDNDYSGLVIRGTFTVEELSAAWHDIYEQYIDGTGSDTQKEIVRLVKKIALADFKLKKLAAIQKYTSYRQGPEVYNLLRGLGAIDTNYPDTPELQKIWLGKAEAKIKRWMLQQERDTADLEKLRGNETGVTITRQYFDDFIVSIELYAKMHINTHVVTVSRFVSIVKNYQRHSASLEKQLNQK